MRIHPMLRRLTGASAIALSLVIVSAAPAAVPFTGEVELMLLRPPKGEQVATAKGGPKMFLYIEAREGQWQRPWAKGVGIFEHYGLIDSATVTDARMQLKVRLVVDGDFWVRGRWAADHTISLSRQPGNVLRGTYKGHYAGKPVAGVVKGRVLPPRATGLLRPSHCCHHTALL